VYIGPLGLLGFILFRVVSPLLSLYFWIVVISALLSWVQPDPYNPVVRTIYGLTEPAFDWVREHLPVQFSGIDLSPIVVIVVIELIQQWLIPTVFVALGGMA
jgi:YggT family protein